LGLDFNGIGGFGRLDWILEDWIWKIGFKGAAIFIPDVLLQT
jgi:hypothetical protein